MAEQVLAEELHTELIPGTEVMRDVGDVHFVHGPKSGAVLIPHPSEDPADPLNWTLPWKYLAVVAQTLFTWTAVASALSMAPMFPLLGAEFGLDETQESLLTGVCVLALGYANFIIVPLSNIFGRRMTSLLLCVFSIGTCIWEAEAKSYNSLLAARVLNGFGTATSESLMVQVVADIFFLHERGFWAGIYLYGWRSFFWLSLALSCVNLLALVFVFPETKFARSEPPIQHEGHIKEAVDVAPPEKDTSSQHEYGTRLPVSQVGKGRPSKSQYKLWQQPDPAWKSFLIRDIVAPVPAFFIPIILWAALNVAGPANLLLLWNLTESSVLSSPPYNFSVSAVGYANFAFVVGGLIGLATAGPLSDKVAERATRRNNGIREAEMRLPALIPFFVTSVIGIVIGSCAIQYKWHWAYILVIGYGLTGLCVTSVPTIAIAYAVDCYKPISGEIMVVATVIKNTCGFAMSYWVTPLNEREGFIAPGMVEFALTIGPILLGLPLYFWGKKLRHLTRNSPVHRWETKI
ncbi:putative mfs transporter [Phaeomoniella chlamydospora]|uniref:Putative mfs transporter n=1 Tax=Phaeomoniella chlamydospora TaxID=158046 RepID=A0A0G2F4L9_PHACM|nr:putative mfs transporter [Phaeomoniella chlamydospora]